MIEGVVWLLLALETGKFSGSIHSSFHASPEACQEAALVATSTSHYEGRFSRNLVQTQREAQSWSCIPMVDTGFDTFNGFYTGDHNG